MLEPVRRAVRSVVVRVRVATGGAGAALFRAARRTPLDRRLVVVATSGRGESVVPVDELVGELRGVVPRSRVVVLDDARASRVRRLVGNVSLGRAGLVLLDRPLPAFYRGRVGQRVALTWDARSSWDRDDGDAGPADHVAAMVRTLLHCDVVVHQGAEHLARLTGGEIRLGAPHAAELLDLDARRLAGESDAQTVARVLVDESRPGPSGPHPTSPGSRPRVLLYLGPFHANGITTSALNLTREIDHEAYDVTVVYPADCPRPALAAVDRRVRLIPWAGPPGLRGSEERVRAAFERHGLDGPGAGRAAVEALFDREWRRVFGKAQFDHVLNFEGYGPYWAMLLSRAPSRRSIWLHNQLWTDAHKYVEGRQPNRERLLAVFSTYSGYQDLVSVSEPLARLNAQDLARFAGDARFVSVRNMLPAAELLVLRRSDGTPAPGGPRTFVSVGRLSPEKGHALVVAAFRRVHDVEPSTRLVVLGDGPERRELEDLVADLGLDDAVTIAGHVDDALARVARSSCLVLASSHEGAPMVILEARALGVPVISADFPSVAGVLPPGSGIVVPREVGSLAEAMLGTLHHENGSVLDPRAWNVSAGEDLRALVARTVAETHPRRESPTPI